MSKLLGQYGNATARDVAKWFGLKGVSQFPPEGLASIEVQGHTVWVAPKDPKRMTIRTMTKCLTCGKEVQVGRLAQHHKQSKNHGDHMNAIPYHCARRSVERMESDDVNGARVWSWMMTSAISLGL